VVNILSTTVKQLPHTQKMLKGDLSLGRSLSKTLQII